jgi:hypothetical protein
VTVLATGWRLYIPSARAHPSWEEENVEYGYREPGVEMSMPAVTVFHPELGHGFSFFPTLPVADQHLKVTCNHIRERNILRIACTRLAIAEKRSVEVAISVKEHEGTWDAGLRFIRESFSDS